ncbi:MAG TPA: hypothetical protein VKQ34_04400, partial [Candidatus Saccharimonadales bacterium]|nr:hypothetical protein [Candidatus Saccharimonadales bacterium]
AIVDRLKQSNNILVTVSSNPSVDQLAACIGLTLALNKMGKHATAVFSGTVPSTIEFLQPEKTLEKNTDSLRDFIIALDKAKADKLRYKVEDKVVKIFITPYKTSINESDLNFSQGDFNVDAVIALGVHNQQDLDQAITSHGRILHDAVVGTINVQPGGDLGSMNWLETRASSLSELVAELVDAIDKQLMDGQMATALLTGIVAETKRFSNDKTSPMTMSISAELMAAGANQQLVATKLEAPAPAPTPTQPAQPISQTPAEDQQVQDMPKAADDGTLEITHADGDKGEGGSTGGSRLEQSAEKHEAEALEELEPRMPQIHIDEHGSLQTFDEQKKDEGRPPVLPAPDGTIDPTDHMASQHMILQPPSSMGREGDMTPGTSPEDIERPSGDPLSLPQPASNDVPLLGHEPLHVEPSAAAGAPTFTPPPLPPLSPVPDQPATPPAPTVVTPTAISPPTPPPVIPAEPAPVIGPMLPPAPAATPFVSPLPTPQSNQTLSALEQEVHSPHLAAGNVPMPNNVAPPILPPSDMVTPSPAPPAPAPVVEPQPQPPILPPAQPSEVIAPSEPVAPPPAPANPQAAADLESAREAVMKAIAGAPPATPEPIQALNAQPLGGPLHTDEATSGVVVGDQNGSQMQPGNNPLMPQGPPTVIEPTNPNPNVPPVPPPMMPPPQGF